MKRYVIYVPGILDDIYKAQSTPVWFWRFLGVRSSTHVMPWAGKEPFEPKFARLLAEIDRYAQKGYEVSLVGASAGASAVLNAYDARRGVIAKVIIICAKINRPDSVSNRTYQENPAFKTSMERLQGVLPALTPEDTATMLSLYSEKDTSVPREDTVIPGVQEERLPGLSHGKAIIYSLTFGARRIIRFMKS